MYSCPGRRFYTWSKESSQVNGLLHTTDLIFWHHEEKERLEWLSHIFPVFFSRMLNKYGSHFFTVQHLHIRLRSKNKALAATVVTCTFSGFLCSVNPLVFRKEWVVIKHIFILTGAH